LECIGAKDFDNHGSSNNLVPHSLCIFDFKHICNSELTQKALMSLKKLRTRFLLLLGFAFFGLSTEGISQIAILGDSTGCGDLIAQFVGPADVWNFGNGPAVAAGPNPTRIYNTPGTYQVSRAGAPGFFVTIRVFPQPVAAFGGTPLSGCTPHVVNFTDSSTVAAGSTITSWLWNFGDGNSSTLQNPTHTYTTTGNFSVALRVRTSNGCENILTRSNYVATVPGLNVTFTPTQSLSCTAPHTVNFANTTTGVPPGSTIQWEFFNHDPLQPQGIGGPVSPSINTTANNPTVTFNTLGDYTVRLRITDPGGCVSSLVRPNMVRLRQYGLAFTSAVQPGPGGSCSPVPVRFTNQFQNVNQPWQTVTWEFRNSLNVLLGTISGQASQSSIVNPVFNFPGSGTYSVSVSAQGTLDNCPIQSAVQTITIGGLPQASFTLNDSTSCTAPLTVNFNASSSINAFTYEWDFDNNGSIDASIVNPSFTYTAPGFYTVRLTVRDTGGCASTLTRTNLIRIQPIQAGFNVLNPNGCNALNGTYTANFQDTSNTVTSIANWNWTFFDSLNNPVGFVIGGNPAIHQNPSFTFTTDTAINRGRAAYSVRLIITTIDGCIDTTFSNRVVRVGNTPVARFTSAPPFGCANTSVNFTYQGSVPFDSTRWFPLGYGDISTFILSGSNPNFSHTYNGDPNVYFAGLVVYNGGCADSTRYSIANPSDPRFTQFLPRASFTHFINNCEIGDVHFVDASIGAQKWVWSFGDPLSTVLSDSITKYLPGQPPLSIRNPVFTYTTPGNYTVNLQVSHDNAFVVRDTLGNPRKNAFFIANSTPFTYQLNATGDSLLQGPITTEDSLLIVRCVQNETRVINVPAGADQTVTFTSDYDSAAQNCKPVTVNFTLTTPGATSVFWNFGNGTTSTLPNPTVLYNEPGSYSIEIVVTTVDGCRFARRFVDYIRINGPRVSMEYCESAACVGEQIQFVDRSYARLPITTRTWNMGNGTIFSSDPFLVGSTFRQNDSLRNFNYFYSLPLPNPDSQTFGVKVILTVTDQRGCTASDSFNIRPTQPIVDMSVNQIPRGCDRDSIIVSVVNSPINGFAPFRFTYQVFDTTNSVTPLFTVGPTLQAFTAFNLNALNDSVPRFYDVRVTVEDFKYYEDTIGCTSIATQRIGVFPGRPEAFFTFVADTNTCPGRSVQFNDSVIRAIRGTDTIAIVSWLWDFGDSSTSILPNPAHIYSIPNPAGYTVTLTVVDAAGCSDTYVLSNAIEVRGIRGTYIAQEASPNFGAQVTTSGVINGVVQGPFNPLPFSVQFTAQLLNPSDSNLVQTYIWDFGDGNTGTGRVVTYTYATPGTFLPRLIIRSIDTCDASATNQVTVIATGCPSPTITGDSVVCRGETFQLIGTPPSTGLAPFTNPTWTVVGTGTVVGTTDTLTATLNSTVELQYSITDSTGCVSFARYLITVLQPQVVDAGLNQTKCIGQDVTITPSITGGTGAFTYTWTASPTIVGLGSTPTITVPSLGTTTLFTLVVLDTLSGCTANDNITVTVLPRPTLNAGVDRILCSGNTVNLNPTFSGGTGNPANFTFFWSPVFGLSNPSIRNPNVTIVNQTLATTVRSYIVTMLDSIGCDVSDTVRISVPPAINITGFPDRVICLGNTEALNGNFTGGIAPFSINWSVISGAAGSITPTTILTPNVNPNVSTQYRLTITDSAGCTATRNVNVNINPPINASAGPDRFVCRNANIQLQGSASGGTGNLIYNWVASPSLTFSNPAASNPQVFTIQDSARVVLTITDQNACLRRDTTFIRVSKPIADAGPNRIICSGDSATFNGTGSGGFGTYSYQWLTFNGLSSDVVQNPRVSRLNPTSSPQVFTYFMVVRDSINCTSPNDSVFLTVNPRPNSNFSGLDTAYCVNAPSVNLTPATPGGVFSGPGTTSGGVFNPATAGLGFHTIQYTVAALGCGDTTRKTVLVSPLPVATFAPLPATICRNAPPIVLVPTVTGGVFSGPGVSGNVFNPANAAVTGLVTIKYVLSVGGCPDSTTRTITILPTPNPFFTGPDTIVCVNAPVSFMSPIVSGGTFSGQGVVGNSFSPTLAGPGIRFVQYRISSGGCTDSLVRQVIVNALPNANFSGIDQLNCVNQGSRVLIPVLPGGVFSGNGVVFSSSTGIYTFNPALADTGVHTVQYRVTLNGCTDSVRRTIRLNRSVALPDSAIRVCEGIATTLSAKASSTNGSNLFKFGWSLLSGPTGLPVGVSGLRGEDVIDSISNPEFLAGNRPGNYRYRLRVIDSTGCRSDNDTFQIVTVVPKPIIAKRDSIIFCFEEGIRTTISIPPIYSTYLWVLFNDSTPNLSVILPGFYSYQVTDSTGCRNQDSLKVVELCAPRVFIPNAFTPNGDGLNDSLVVFGKYYRDLEMTIFNRWGEVVYIQKPGEKPWDGTYRGEMVQSGTYVYEVQYVSVLDGAITRKRGNLSVLK
jgi:gliding motility-associated-like protein